ncbi:MAG TPA: tetratricopeptide repeat protein [Polyangiaceae bacterium]|nr:tetratricopeptide repeat protein [Polyangiaceae bacterium]
MASSRTPASTHPPKARIARGSSPPKKQGELELRLAIARDGLGIELGAPARLGPLDVTELAMTLPAVRFPVDVSGGVQRFRHRRGVLERMTFELQADALSRAAAPELRGLLGEKTPQLFVAVRPWGATIGIADDELGRALAFEIAVDAYEDELRLTVFGSRGLGLQAPAAALAAQAVEGVLKKRARREGSRFVIEEVPAHVARALLPDAGARAPDCRGARFTAITCASDAWILHVSRGVAAPTTDDAVRAREAATLLKDADDARMLGDFERARALDLYCLERAPRHAEVCRRIADLDRLAGGRAEAARAILSDASEPTHSWALAGELAIEAHDASGAASALLRAAEEEIIPALAALALERGASVAPDAIEALSWLDRAIARAPTSARLHWTRAAARIALGRMRDALADVEEIEAMTRGAGAKHAVWRRAATLWTTAGHAAEARALFERALRFMPDDAASLAGLGTTMIAQGKVARGVALLSRALQHAERSRGQTVDTSPYALALAHALAEQLGDRPAAIARVRTIGSAAREAVMARGLEGRWRAALGDKAGASLAYAQMRDLAASASELGPADEARALLLEAATFERKARADVAAAQAHLGVALRLFPRDAAVAGAYRDVNDVLSSPSLPSEVSPSTVADRPKAGGGAYMDADSHVDADDDEARADDLLRRYRGAPNDDRIVDELATVLTRLGRSHEVLALLAGRYEDASPERRAALAPAQIEVLARLERDARDRGHDHEAQLFRDAIAAMGGAIEP